MGQFEELKKTFLEEYESALLLMSYKRDKSATILLAKALFALVDCILFRNYHVLPKNHAERFRVLGLREKEIYQIVDSVWSKYTDTYSKPTLAESVMLLKSAIKDVVKKDEGIDQEIKASVEKA